MIAINIPGVRVLWHSLYDCLEPEFLTQDLFLGRLPNGDILDVDWSPEHDPDGNFYCSLIRNEDWRSPLRVLQTRTPTEVPGLLETLAAFSKYYSFGIRL
jgi:hypothetical protein